MRIYGGQDDRVVWCATIASQTAEMDGIDRVAAKSLPLLLLHGTGDRTLAPECSERLFGNLSTACEGYYGVLQAF